MTIVTKLKKTTSLTSSQYLLKSEREYAIYVLANRAIPYVADGLKSGQRLALWVLKNRPEKIKTYSLSGLLAYERLYVHGDASANNTINLLAAPFKNNNCLIEGLGQFGSKVIPDKEGIGQPRYTDVKRSKVSEAIMYNDSDLIPLEGNYDDSNVQPKHFLPIIPMVLLNGVSGIAVGWSTYILPYSMKSLIQATKQAVLGKPIQKLIPHFERYDVTVKASDKPNQWIFSGKVTCTKNIVHISELPPSTSLVEFKQFLNDLEEAETIVSYVDRSTDVIDITIKLAPLKYLTEDEALDFFKLREKSTERIVVLSWDRNSIAQYACPEDLVKDFAEWRLGWYKVRFQKMIEDAANEMNFWKAIVILYQKKFPAKLGSFMNKVEMETEIVKLVPKIAEYHVSRVVNMATYRWTKELDQDAKEKIQTLTDNIDAYKKTLGDPNALKQVYIGELDAIDTKKLGCK